MAEMIEFETERVSRHIQQHFTGFLNDPCDSRFQQGYLAALLDLYTQGMNKGEGDDRIAVLRRQTEFDVPDASPMWDELEPPAA